MVSFIDAYRSDYGVESICAQLPIAPSQYYAHKAREADPSRLPPRLQRDRALKPEIERIRATDPDGRVVVRVAVLPAEVLEAAADRPVVVRHVPVLVVVHDRVVLVLLETLRRCHVRSLSMRWRSREQPST
mgnify:CR=1 FL=1